MKRNEKILASALAIMIAGYIAWRMADPIFFAPIREGEEKVSMYDKQVKDKQAEQTQLLVAEKRVANWTEKGLPGDPLNAQRLYQQWLADLASATGLDVQPQAGPRRAVGGIYNSIQVTLKGTGTFSELQSFLQKFNQVDLVHRAAVVDIDNVTSTEGDAELPIQVTAEALNIKGAKDRARLFPQFELSSPIAPDASTLPVATKSLRAKAGDLIRLGEEFLTVVDVTDDHVKVERGSAGTTAKAHTVGTIAELFPLKQEPSAALASFSEMPSPFAKPRNYDPKFEGLDDQKLVRGNELKLPIKINDYDRAAGAPKIDIAKGPEGMTYDAATNSLKWIPSAEMAADSYEVSVIADIPFPQKRLEKTFRVSLTERNQAPQLEAIPDRDIFLGETLRISLKALDPDGDSEPLSFKIERGPEGATVNSETGELTWAIPSSFSPGEVPLEVSVSDAGEPPLSSKQSVTVKVLENLKPFVKLVSTIDDGDRSAWLWNQAEGRRVTLAEGQAFEVAGLKATTKEIGNRYVVFERGDELWRIRLGDSLEQAERTPVEPVSSEFVPVEAPRPAAQNLPTSPNTAKLEG